MKILLVVRHAKAIWTESETEDHERDLEPQGTADAVKLGKFLRDEGIIPNTVLTSSAVRAMATASLIVDNLGQPHSIIDAEDKLYNASAETILAAVQAIEPAKSVAMVVGHNPGISNFVSLITDGSPLNMGACDLAIVALEISAWTSCIPNTGFLSRYIENY